MTNIIRSSFLSGVCIGIAGFGYLAEKSIIGAVLFAFGLLTVVHYGLKLYTGTAGFIRRGELIQLMIILLFNIIGCLGVSLIARSSPMPLQETAMAILHSRLSSGPINGFVLAIGCGFIMTQPLHSHVEGNIFLYFSECLCSSCAVSHIALPMPSTILQPLSHTYQRMPVIS